MVVVYDYDDLGRPIVADMYRDKDSGVYVFRRTFFVNIRCHDWGLGGRSRPRNRTEHRLVTLLRAIYRWGRYYGLPSYVIDTAALMARKVVIKLHTGSKVGLVAVALLKLAARRFGINFRAVHHRKDLMRVMRKVRACV